MPRATGSTKLAKLCDVTKTILSTLPPREFSAKALARYHLLFTDGAWENDQATARILLHNSDTNETVVREIMVSIELVELWKNEAGEQIIWQIEFFAYLAARFEYNVEVENHSVIAWLDNEAAGFAAGKGSANSTSLMAHARLVTLEARNLSVIWVERLCSFSNPSDKPSRKQCKEAARMFTAMHDERPICLQEKVILAIKELTTDPYGVICLEGIFD